MGLETDCLVNTAADQTGVLMVHGIQGRPKQFSFLAQSLPENVMTNCLLFRKAPADPYVLATKEANSVTASTPLAYAFCLHPYMDLLRLIRRVRKMKPPSVPVNYYFSEVDEIVSPRSALIAKKHEPEAVHFLKKCGHQYITEEAKKELIKDFLQIVGGSDPHPSV